MAEKYTIRYAMWHILGKALAESIISEMGPDWAKVSACAHLKVKQNAGKRLDHIDRFFLRAMDYESGRLDDAGWVQAKAEFRQDHLAPSAST